MATSEATSAAPAALEGVSSTLARRIRLDWLIVAASAWLGAGLYWDGWAHGYGLPDSFWTIWHAAFYSGFGACAAVILGAVVLKRPRATSWRAAIPAGYEYAVAGVFIFGVGGIFDTLWHSIFGIEFSTDALLSPSHLVLATGAALIVSAPFAAARRAPRPDLARQLPAVISLTFLLGTFTFFTLYAGPYSGVIGAGLRPSDATLVRAMLGVILFSAIIVGCALVGLRRGVLVPGALTVMLGLNGVAMILMRGHASLEVQLSFALVAIAAGAVGDFLVSRLRPSPDRVIALRAFAFLLPAVYFAMYLGIVVWRVGSGWTVHELTGMVTMAGIVGLLTSFVFAGDARGEVPAA